MVGFLRLQRASRRGWIDLCIDNSLLLSEGRFFASFFSLNGHRRTERWGWRVNNLVWKSGLCQLDGFYLSVGGEEQTCAVKSLENYLERSHWFLWLGSSISLFSTEMSLMNNSQIWTISAKLLIDCPFWTDWVRHFALMVTIQNWLLHLHLASSQVYM